MKKVLILLCTTTLLITCKKESIPRNTVEYVFDLLQAENREDISNYLYLEDCQLKETDTIIFEQYYSNNYMVDSVKVFQKGVKIIKLSFQPYETIKTIPINAKKGDLVGYYLNSCSRVYGIANIKVNGEFVKTVSIPAIVSIYENGVLRYKNLNFVKGHTIK